MSGAVDFYDGLAGEYDRLYPDWWSAARWHGSVVGAVLAGEGVLPPAAVLDCACGIGTQALPLAATGYAVTGTDVSAVAVERARREAAGRAVDLTLAVADMRQVRDRVDGLFDAAVVCDNALAHLLTDDDLLLALRSVRACLRPGGLFLASVRDYDALALTRPAGVPISMHGEPGARHASGQAWSWSPSGEHVDITLFVLVESSSGWRATSHETTCRAVTRPSLTSALRTSGFDGVRWLTPDESGYHQPVVLARAPQVQVPGRTDDRR